MPYKDTEKEAKFLTEEDVKALVLLIENSLSKHDVSNRFFLLIEAPTGLMVGGTSCPVCISFNLLSLIVEGKIDHLNSHEGPISQVQEVKLEREKGQNQTDRPIIINPKSKHKH
jgi:hypothetical protein